MRFLLNIGPFYYHTLSLYNGKCRSFYDYYGVFGPVSKVSYYFDDKVETINFNRLGEPRNIPVVNGEIAGYLLRKKYDVYDNRGRIIKAYDSGDPEHAWSGTEEMKITYDSSDRVIQIDGAKILHLDDEDLKYTEFFIYDKQGKLTEYQSYCGKRLIIRRVLEYFEFDSFQNWHIMIDRSVDGSGYSTLTRREIEYFE